MTVKKENKTPKNLMSSLIGSALLVVGITLVLTQWEYVVMFFRGVSGIVLALIGLFILMMIKS